MRRSGPRANRPRPPGMVSGTVKSTRLTICATRNVYGAYVPNGPGWGGVVVAPGFYRGGYWHGGYYHGGGWHGGGWPGGGWHGGGGHWHGGGGHWHGGGGHSHGGGGPPRRRRSQAVTVRVAQRLNSGCFGPMPRRGSRESVERIAQRVTAEPPNATLRARTVLSRAAQRIVA
jgi:hypothetical protein